MLKKIIAGIGKWNVKKSLVVMFLTIIVMSFIGYLSLVVVYTIPVDGRMNHNIQSSAEKFLKEGSYVGPSGRGSTLDNFTDALMVLSAGEKTKNGIMVDAIDIPRKVCNDKDPVEVIVASCITKNCEEHIGTYGRYWHGYLLYLKPLLWLMSYRHIRDIIAFLQLGLFLMVIWKLFKEQHVFVLPFCAAWFFLRPVSTMLSLQFFSMTTLMFLGVLGVLHLQKEKVSLSVWSFYFMFIGILASYLDLLTFPLITLGVPLLLWYCCCYKENIKLDLKRIVTLSASWTLGYGGFWFSKWVLGSLITGNNLLLNAWNAIIFRASGGYKEHVFTLLSVLKRRVGTVDPLFWGVFIMITLYIGYQLYRRNALIEINILLPILFIATYPIIWYLALRNHSGIHYFTYRTLVILPCSILTYLMMMIEKSKNAENSSTNPVL